MDNRAKQIKDVEDILSNSDIVWPKYGSESKTELATKIVDSLIIGSLDLITKSQPIK
jgi:hypothetical protein